jgi:hypothetical protein
VIKLILTGIKQVAVHVPITMINLITMEIEKIEMFPKIDLTDSMIGATIGKMTISGKYQEGVTVVVPDTETDGIVGGMADIKTSVNTRLMPGFGMCTSGTLA